MDGPQDLTKPKPASVAREVAITSAHPDSLIICADPVKSRTSFSDVLSQNETWWNPAWFPLEQQR